LVYLDDERVGWFEERDGGSVFGYDATWLTRADAQPISLTFPLREEPYASKGVHPFFLGLLPEGWLFDLALARLKVSRSDPFGLVLASCRDCIGAVRILPEDAETDRSGERP
jgi:serine/threonine-protein kinase HipA